MDRPEGTKPEFFSYISRSEAARGPDALREAAALQRSAGATFFRATEMPEPDGGVWLEGWLVQPVVQAPFDPPYTLAEQA